MLAPNAEPLLEGFGCQVSGFREKGAVNPGDYDNYLSIVYQLRSLSTYFFPNLLGICFRVEIMRSFF